MATVGDDKDEVLSKSGPVFMLLQLDEAAWKSDDWEAYFEAEAQHGTRDFREFVKRLRKEAGLDENQ